ncbi:MAG: [protein-PII] uridylyltransferase [Actinomycetales bacterium]
MALFDDLLSTAHPDSPRRAGGSAADEIGARARQARAGRADAWVRGLWDAAGFPGAGWALLAVGGYGRGELAPASDLDLVLVHEAGEGAPDRAARLWYPLWDSGVRIDHAVRTPADLRRVAAEDLAVVVGMVDARLVAGDAALGARSVAAVLADWRAGAHRRLGPLRGACAERAARSGEVAFALEPDLKEGRGGLRDAAVLRAVAASWLADRPHGRVDAAMATLADVRDALHLVAGRPTERLLRDHQVAVAQLLGLPVEELRRSVAAAGRDVAHALDGVWRRAMPGGDGRRRRRLLVPGRSRSSVRLAPGVDLSNGEAVLAADADPADPSLPLRVAAAAAEADVLVAPATVELLAAAPPLPVPWPRSAREALLTLLGAGPACLGVWEDFDRAGAVAAWLPEWEPVRSLPQRSAAHRWTVDRHLVETAIQASHLARRVRRPDLLLLAALTHDLGKAAADVDHPRAGVGPTRSVGARLGLSEADLEVLARLTEHHLLLAQLATRRDLDDPATVDALVAAVPDADSLELLHALTEADSRATGPGTWTAWRSSLVGDLVARAHARLLGVRPPVGDEPRRLEALDDDVRRRAATAPVVVVKGEAGNDGAVGVRIVALDRPGLLATVAGALALQRLAVRSAVVVTEGPLALQDWQVESETGDWPDAVALRETLRRALEGTLDVSARLAARDAAYAPTRRSAAGATGGSPVAARPPARVDVVADASVDATVIEVRAHDAPGLLHRVATAVTAAGASIRSARVATWGAEAVDALYLVNSNGAALDAGAAARVAEAVSRALAAPAARPASAGSDG